MSAMEQDEDDHETSDDEVDHSHETDDNSQVQVPTKVEESRGNDNTTGDGSSLRKWVNHHGGL